MQKSDKEVEVKRLHTSIVPGVEFGVYASVSKVMHLTDHEWLSFEDFLHLLFQNTHHVL